ncbi:MAG: hypothetical protein HQK51_01555 [Oligoflexia bacterium]|nr:hypothetical protein [Oligoflexia bacterium]
MLSGGELADRTIAIDNRIGDQRTFQILDDDLLKVIANVHQKTEKKRKELLSSREKRQREYDQGCASKLSRECNWKDNPEWKISKIANNLKKRSREIFVSASDTVQLIKLINQQNSGNLIFGKGQSNRINNNNSAQKTQFHQLRNSNNNISSKMFFNNKSEGKVVENTFNLILDFEDMLRNNWSSVVDGIFTAKGALLGDLLHQDDDNEKKIHQLKNKLSQQSQFIIRIRNIEKTESTITINNQKIAAPLFDIITNCYYLLNILKDQNRNLHFYIPKCDHYLEARYYQQIFSLVEEELSLPLGMIKVTIQIDSLNAFTQAEEILYELKNYSTGLYIYPLGMLHSYHKMYRNYNEMILPNLSGIVQQEEWHNTLYAKLSQICHRRNAQLLVGYNNFLVHDGLSKIEKSIIKNNLQDELRRLKNHDIDGIVLYHPSLLSLLDEISNVGDNNISKLQQTSSQQTSSTDTNVDANSLLLKDQTIFSFLPKNNGPKTLNELRFYIRKGILFVESMLRNKVPLYTEYATFTQLSFDVMRWHTWHWIYHKATIEEWGPLNKNFVKKLFEDEYERLLFEQKEKGIKISHNLIEHWNNAKEKAKSLFTSDLLVDCIL